MKIWETKMKISGGTIPVCEGGDDKPWSVSKVLVAVLELRVTDVCKTVTLLVIPSGETNL